MYWQLGKLIFEEEQQGKERANYGQFLIKLISQTFQPQFGKGFSVRQLERYRQFYRNFQLRPHCGRNSAGHTIKTLLIILCKQFNYGTCHLNK
jgi:hypothetical protein